MIDVNGLNKINIKSKLISSNFIFVSTAKVSIDQNGFVLKMQALFVRSFVNRR